MASLQPGRVGQLVTVRRPSLGRCRRSRQSASVPDRSPGVIPSATFRPAGRLGPIRASQPLVIIRLPSARCLSAGCLPARSDFAILLGGPPRSPAFTARGQRRRPTPWQNHALLGGAPRRPRFDAWDAPHALRARPGARPHLPRGSRTRTRSSDLENNDHPGTNTERSSAYGNPDPPIAPCAAARPSDRDRLRVGYSIPDVRGKSAGTVSGVSTLAPK